MGRDMSSAIPRRCQILKAHSVPPLPNCVPHVLYPLPALIVRRKFPTATTKPSPHNSIRVTHVSYGGNSGFHTYNQRLEFPAQFNPHVERCSVKLHVRRLVTVNYPCDRGRV
jgi:hypothetical protein